MRIREEYIMKRRLVSIFLVVFLLLLAGCGKGTETGVVEKSAKPTKASDQADDKAKDKNGGKKAENQIIVGNTTEMSGDWIPYWQNNAADKDVYDMITGQGTVETTKDGKFVINDTVVKNHDIKKNEDGSKTYVWTIKDGLVYDDGSPITAKDYVASYLLWSSPQVGDAGANNSYGYYLKGWKDFSGGKSKVFSGVRLTGEKTFEVTLSADELPYFYELDAAAAAPTKLSFWTDDQVDIKDDGEGCYFSDNFTTDAYKEKFNQARRAIPRPSTGPYVLKSYDESSKTAVLEINDKFPGDRKGQKPSIQKVIMKKVNEDTQFDELSTHAVDLLVQAASGDDINAGLDLVQKGGFAYTKYPRSGYGMIQFACDSGPTQFVEVRQALAHLLDRNDFANSFTGGFGSVVNGPYGESMWFYQETKAELNEKLDQYAYSLDKAKELLEKGGWVYDEKGNKYQSGIRYKKMDDGSLMPLVINWASSEKNEVSEMLVVKLMKNPDVAAAGMEIKQTVMTFSELLNWLYRDGSEDAKYAVPTYQMFNLASGFTPAYDLMTQYTIDPKFLEQGTNTNFIKDEKLAKLAKDMVKVDPDDKETYKKNFVAFIERWNELLPDIPLYSNIYHDFYAEKLKDYEKNDLMSLGDALLYAHVE